ncbi:uncharacterized protein ARMOST_10069 [Armillaria ostoyae]|uniref:Uncharacterized protein n=1 Tax=Armillaria ostoyae TaxID=47428 RepID=A0A284RD86_ARMOS|nr:uncharacterized protein ARMOST_10069 [Armillaria ostoyae]
MTVTSGVVINTGMIRPSSVLPSTSASVTAASGWLNAAVNIKTLKETVKKTNKTVLFKDKDTPTGSTSIANDDRGRVKQKIAEPVQPKLKKS